MEELIGKAGIVAGQTLKSLSERNVWLEAMIQLQGEKLRDLETRLQALSAEETEKLPAKQPRRSSPPRRPAA
jgi:hypothetical protein